MCYIHNKLKTILIILIIFYSTNCIANDKIINDTSCELIFKSSKTLSNNVLVGTDVVNVKVFENSTGHLENNYSTEIGGAILTLSIISSPNKLIIERKYKEPGELIHERIYKSICVAKGYIYAENLIVNVVHDGILVLESKPDVEGIPKNLWIFYEKKKK